MNGLHRICAKHTSAKMSRYSCESSFTSELVYLDKSSIWLAGFGRLAGLARAETREAIEKIESKSMRQYAVRSI